MRAKACWQPRLPNGRNDDADVLAGLDVHVGGRLFNDAPRVGKN